MHALDPQNSFFTMCHPQNTVGTELYLFRCSIREKAKEIGSGQRFKPIFRSTARTIRLRRRVRCIDNFFLSHSKLWIAPFVALSKDEIYTTMREHAFCPFMTVITITAQGGMTGSLIIGSDFWESRRTCPSWEVTRGDSFFIPRDPLFQCCFPFFSSLGLSVYHLIWTEDLKFSLLCTQGTAQQGAFLLSNQKEQKLVTTVQVFNQK